MKNKKARRAQDYQKYYFRVNLNSPKELISGRNYSALCTLSFLQTMQEENALRN
jgi:hypothetical protein